MVSALSHGFHWLVLFFVFWTIVLSAIDVYFFAKLRDGGYTISSGWLTALLILNIITLVVALILGVYAIYHYFVSMRADRVEPTSNYIPMKDACGKPACKTACPVKKPVCKTSCPPLKKDPCDPCNPGSFDGSLFHRAVENFKCYVDAMKSRKDELQERINHINKELNDAKSEFKGACSGVDVSGVTMSMPAMERPEPEVRVKSAGRRTNRMDMENEF